MRSIFLFCSLALLLSCNNENNRIVDFILSEAVECQPLDNSTFISLPLKIANNDNYLFITDFYGDSLISIYDKQAERKIGMLAPVGNGPGEFLTPIDIWLRNGHLYILDRRKFRLGYYDLQEIGQSINPTYHYLFNIPSSVSMLAQIGDNEFIASGYFEDGRYAIINERGEIERYFGSYPDFISREQNRPFEARAMFHQVSFSVNHQLNRVAAVSNSVLDIIDFSASDVKVVNRIQLVRYDYDFIVGHSISVDKKKYTPNGVESTCSNNNNIFIACNLAIKNTSDDQENEIWVFDWDGNPVKKLLPGCSIETINTIGDKQLIGVDNTAEPLLILISTDPISNPVPTQ